MPTPTYSKLLTVVEEYLGKERAMSVIGRQMERCSASQDTLSAAHLAQIMNFLVGGATLYLHPDKNKQQALTASLKALV